MTGVDLDLPSNVQNLNVINQSPKLTITPRVKVEQAGIDLFHHALSISFFTILSKSNILNLFETVRKRSQLSHIIIITIFTEVWMNNLWHSQKATTVCPGQTLTTLWASSKMITAPFSSMLCALRLCGSTNRLISTVLLWANKSLIHKVALLTNSKLFKHCWPVKKKKDSRKNYNLVIFYLTPCWCKVKWAFMAHKTFLELVTVIESTLRYSLYLIWVSFEKKAVLMVLQLLTGLLSKFVWLKS